MSVLPTGFEELETYVADWARPTRKERYEMRLSKPYEELCEFYDAAGPRVEDAIVHLNGRDINGLDEPSLNLLRMLYSVVLVSYAVNVFNQPKIPDSGSAWVETTVEPVI